MNTRICAAALVCALAALAAPGSARAAERAPAVVPVALPGASAHAGFDDMGYVAALNRIVVPGGDTGTLYLISPGTDTAFRIAQVAPAGAPKGRRDAGTTSAAYAHGYFIASDHADQSLAIVNGANSKVVKRVRLAAGSDYVRYLSGAGQVWVTEPEAHQIQVFDADFKGKMPALTPVGTISVPGGPEALVVDEQTGRAYTNLWKSDTLVIDVRSRKVVARWPNGCEGSRGLALAPAEHLLFVGCTEGNAVALNLAANGAVAASAPTGAGVDIIAWNPALKHLYVPGARSATLTILALGPGRHLHPVATVPTAEGAHCVATDGRNKAYVCDPLHGRVLAVTDAR